MLPETKLLYTKRYPDAEEEALAMESMAEGDFPFKEETEEETKAALAAFWRLAKREFTREPEPEQELKARKFIDCAVKFSEDYEIDIDVKQRGNLVQVDLHLPCIAYPGDIARRLSVLMAMSDLMSIFTPKSNCCTLSLDFHTCSH